MRSCTGEASDVRRALLKSAAVVLQGGATSPRRPGKGTEGQPGRWREGGGDDAIDDDETEGVRFVSIATQTSPNKESVGFLRYPS